MIKFSTTIYKCSIYIFGRYFFLYWNYNLLDLGEDKKIHCENLNSKISKVIEKSSFFNFGICRYIHGNYTFISWVNKKRFSPKNLVKKPSVRYENLKGKCIIEFTAFIIVYTVLYFML